MSYCKHRTSIYLGVFTIMLILLFLPSVSSVQIKYDDGSRDGELAYNDSSKEFAIVKITPLHAGTLESVDAYVRKYSSGGCNANSYKIFVLDGSTNLDFESPTQNAPSNYNWRTYSIPDTNLDDVEYSSDFYVGVHRLDGCFGGYRAPYLGYDTDDPDNQRSYYASSVSGPYHLDSGKDYMIRVNFNYWPTVSNVNVSPNPASVSPTLTATCTDYEGDIDGADYRIDGGTWRSMNASDGSYHDGDEIENVRAIIPISSLSNGEHTVEVRCLDGDNYKTAPADYGSTSFTLIVDTVAPTTTASLSGTKVGNWYASAVNVTLSVSDPSPSSGINYTKYCVDTTNSCIPSTSYSGSFSVSSEGTSYIRFRSADNAGNVEDIKSESVSIDLTGPSAPVLDAFPATHINTNSETLSWSAATDNLSGIDHYEIERNVNSGGFSHLADTIGLTYTDTGLVNDTAYDYRVRAVDLAGNAGAWSNIEGFIVDTVAPSVPFLYALPFFTKSPGEVILNWSPSVDPGSQPSGIYSYDVAEKFGFLGPYNITIDAALHPSTTYTDDGSTNENGLHRYKVRSNDNSDPRNTSEWSNTVATIVDKSEPTTSYLVYPSSPNGNNGWYVTSPTVLLLAYDYQSGIDKIVYCIDSDGTCTPTTADGGWFAVIHLGEGIHYIVFNAVDNAGNISSNTTIGPIKVDLSNPYGQSIVLDDGANYNTTGLVSASLDIGSDDVSGLDYCEISWDGGLSWENVGLADNAGHSYDDGLHLAQYRCFDYAGRSNTPVAEDTIIVDTMPPSSTITVPSENESLIIGNIYVAGTADDATSGISKVEVWAVDSIGNTVAGPVIADGTVSWRAYLNMSSLSTLETYTIKSVATDNAGLVEVDDNVMIGLQRLDGPNMENVYYESGGSKYVFVYGYLPLANTSYDIEVFSVSNGLASATLYSQSATTDSNGYFGVEFDVSSWDKSILYAARVDADGTMHYTQFVGLAVAELRSQLEDLNATTEELIEIVESIDARLSELENDVNNLNAQVESLWIEIENLNSEIADIKDRLASVEADLFGFRDITVSTYVTSFYLNDIEVPITFALKPETSGMYKIQYWTSQKI